MSLFHTNMATNITRVGHVVQFVTDNRIIQSMNF